MDFKDATDRLTKCLTLADIAEGCGVSPNTIRRARMRGEGSRPPPEGWVHAVASLARERAEELEALAVDLEVP